MPLPFRLTGRLAACVAALWIAAAGAAPADDLREAQKLYGQGRVPQAMEKVEAFLKAQPRDPQGRFLKGLLLTEQKRTPEAIQVFTGLTEDFPELPEPYNNLAVLYASQGNYDRAKSALELAIHTHPSYATAHENLGDIYAQLASRAYDRALQLDKTNTTAQLKLSMVKELVSPQKPGQPRAPRPEPKVETIKPEPPRPAEPPKPASPARVDPRPEPKTEAKAPPAAAAKPATVAVAPATTAQAASPAAAGDEKAQVTAAIEGWARAWSAKDVKGYIGHYAPDFEVPGGESRAAWEKQRTERIQKPRSIEVGVKVQSVEVSGNEATARIRQTYKSDTLRSSNTKTLKLVKNGGRWLIKQERVGG